MGFRFQRRLKLFPGVRLNFSRGGISTTIGVRGASLTLGKRGAYANIGIPGTGLSFRQRIGQQPAKPDDVSLRQQVAPDPDTFAPELYEETSVAGAIHSRPVSTMTSAGLDELKKLINEAALKRIELSATIPANQEALRHEQQRLRRARWFIIRLFTMRAIPRLAEKVHAAEAALINARQQLMGCSVEIDFAFDERALNGFAALARSFGALSKCQRIWDVTASVQANRSVERTIANHSVTRKLVALSVSRSEIIETSFNALCFTNANGSDIYLYPGFVMMPSASKDFALIDVRELETKISQTSFIEEEDVPGDSEVIGQTWKKTNKDGSPDRRFADNYQIPIVRYGEIEFRSPSGLYEVYQFSSFSNASTFNQALTEYQNVVASLAERSRQPSAAPVPALQDNSEEIEARAEVANAPAAPLRAPGWGLVFDVVALVVLLAAAGGAGIYFTRQGDVAPQPSAQQLEAPPVASSSVPPVPPSAPLAGSTAVARAPAAQARREVVYVLKPNVNVRSEPLSTSQVLGLAKTGRKLTVFQRQGEWLQVGEDAPIGWVHQSLLGSMPP